MLWTRIASGVVLGPLFLGVVYFEFPTFHILIAAIAGVISWEFVSMAKRGKREQVQITLASLVGVGAAISMVYGGYSADFAVVMGCVYVLIFTVIYLIKLRALKAVAFASAYATVPALALIYVMELDGSFSLFWLLAVVWATDIGAYAVGRTIGGPKLAPAVSPNKTWSGAIGGLVCAMLASAGVMYWGAGQGTTVCLAFLAAGLSVVCQVGDLFESSLKRGYQVKDSGNFIPGHGGVMDRFDGLWMAAPVAGALCLILGGGVRAW